MSLLLRSLLLLLLLLGPIACGGGGGGDDLLQGAVHELAHGDGVRVYQVTFWDPQVPEEGTSWGRLGVEPAALAKTTGLQKGWINVAVGDLWVVTNFPVPDTSELPFGLFFDLGLDQNGPVKALDVHVTFSERSFSRMDEHMGQPTSFPVSEWVVRETGIGPTTERVQELPPYARSVRGVLRRPFEITTWTQAETNVECALNQCGPMGEANAMQYLENMGIWTVPHPHAMGLRGDNTLVGQLDTTMNRTCTSRPSGDGVSFDQMVEGVFEYLAEHDLDGLLMHRHRDQGWASSLPAADYTIHGSTSQYDGGAPTFQWLWDRVREGCGVTVGYSHGSGGHCVRVTGVRRDDVGGVWMRYTHDRIQTTSNPASDSQGLETVWVELEDLDSDGMLNMGAVSREVRLAWAHCP